MTRLPNRTAFLGRLETAIATAAREHAHGALVLFDVDHSKETNDMIGHDAGDLLLQTLADRLTDFLGKRGAIGRLGETNSPPLSTGSTRAPSSVRSRPHWMRCEGLGCVECRLVSRQYGHAIGQGGPGCVRAARVTSSFRRTLRC